MTWSKRDDEAERELTRERLRTPLWCPVCSLVMKGGPAGDDKTYFKWGCCLKCFIEFVEDRENRWSDGWRPDRSDIQRYFDKMGWGDAPNPDSDG